MTVSLTRLAVAALLAVAGPAAAQDACGDVQGRVAVLANDFGALHAVTDAAKACAGDDFTANHTLDHRNLQVAALTANPAQYTVALIANGSISPLLNAGLIRPLDDLVAEHGQSLQKGQLIRLNGKVMAVAFMANAQHLFYRKDLLEQAGLEPPKTYEEVVAAGKAIRDAGLMEYPFAFNSKAGWDLAEEFINMYFGYGGQLFAPGSAEPAVANAQGVDALEMMKSLTELSNPDYLTFDANATTSLWESGQVAMAVMWGSRGTTILDDEGSTPEIVQNTALAAAPTVGDGSIPASTLWWDGFSIAQNTSDEDAEASFVAMLEGISPKTVAANQDLAIWLVEGYQPGPAAKGVTETVAGGAVSYPTVPYVGLLHTALGEELPAFFQGRKSAEQALADAEAAYRAAAKGQGFLN